MAMDAFCIKAGIHGITAPPIDATGNVELRLSAAAAEGPSASPRNFPWGFTFRRPLRSLWPGTKIRLESAIAVDDAVLAEKDDVVESVDENWVSKVLRINSSRKGEEMRAKLEEKCGNYVKKEENFCAENEDCDVCAVDEDDSEKIEFDRESFSKLLRKVSLAESRLYAQLSYLGSLAYCIPQIKGSESLASWKANLLFEPIQFEGLNVLVHRGIYEAAKGIYEHMLPAIHSHLEAHGDRARFRFTGHSLGGSLSVLVNLMLLIRGGAPRSSLLPVITYGAPSIMCGGDRLLHNLGLPRDHVRSITMHRDIVPRAFSCNYPNHVAEFLKAVNGNFRNHPCLDKQKLLYTPMGELLILQPDEKFSPNHDLLPPGSGLYLLTCPASDMAEAEKQVRAAQAVFLNSPHPLEILSDRSAYGSEGSIQRDHDMLSYLKSVRNVIRHDLNRARRARREERQRVWWPGVAPSGGVIVRRPVMIGQGPFNFSGMVRTGRESLKRLVASQHMHLLAVLMFPALGSSINIS